MVHLLLALTAAATLQTRLGVVVQGDDATSRALLAACPRMAVFPLPSTTAPAQMAGYRQACPGGVVAVQLTGTAADVATLQALWFSTWLPQLLALDASQIDAVEGPPDSPASAATLVEFWTSFVQLVRGSGLGPLPVVDASAPLFRSAPADGGSEDGFCATARALRTAGGTWGWSWHAASPTTSTDPQVEAATTLAFRAVRDSCGLAGTPLFVTALRPSSRAWLASDLSWLAFVDGQLALDSDLRGAAAFEAGAAGVFDLSPISGALASYLANPQPVDGGTPDGGTADGGTDGGGDGGAVDAGGGVVSPVVTPGGPLSTSTQPRGCSCSAPGVAAVALAALLVRRRRPRRRGLRG